MTFRLGFFFASLLAICAAEVTIPPSAITIYHKSQKVRIRGTGFDGFESETARLVLEIGSSGQPLKQGVDYTVSVVADGIILKLEPNKQWVDLKSRTPPVGLLLTGVYDSKSPDDNLLPAPVVVANVLETPSIQKNTNIIYQSATNELRINGTGFKGAKYVDLYFQPPLLKEIAYEVVSYTASQVILRLRHGYKWSETIGPLAVVGVDVGGGAVRVSDSDAGVIVALVQSDLDEHSVSVEDSSEYQSIYYDDPVLTITGTGFNIDGTTLRFANGILGKGVNYTIVQTSSYSLSLRLASGSYWRKNTENLPGYLTLLAVDAGGGYVAVGPLNALKGRDVAKVFERPEITASTQVVYRTHSHEIRVKGKGFPTNLATPRFRFNNGILLGRDYTVSVVDRTEVILTLNEGREWGPVAMKLVITHVNGRDDEAGWIKLGAEGVQVADIHDDAPIENTGGVEIYQSSKHVYQSALHTSIELAGNGFVNNMELVFSPPLKLGTDYSMSVDSKNQLTLKLMSGKKWHPDAGYLMAMGVKIGDKKYDFAHGNGIRVAVVLMDPSIKAGTESIHETQSKVLPIRGSAFTNINDMKITLRPTFPNAYKILSVSEDTIRLQLKEGSDWVPNFLSVKSDSKIPVSVFSVDTGAGEVELPEPVVVGYIIADRLGVVCDDTCEFAFDGVCDDGSEDLMYYYDDMQGYYMDDDFGGYYGYGEFAEGDAYGEYQYDDYYMENDNFQVSACLKGTDCTDCGGVDSIVPGDEYGTLPTGEEGRVTCTNTCPYARDGQCDDPRGANYCILGTDCQDCGPVGAENFTLVDDDEWWDDDDDYWAFNDDFFNTQADGVDKNRHKVQVVQTESAGASVVFLTMLEGMVYTIGAIFGSIALYGLIRWYNGESIPCWHVFNPDSMTMADLELTPSRRMPITPDVTRT